MRRLLLVTLGALSLAACVTTPTVYQPFNAESAVGYSESAIEPARWRVTFRGGPGADAAHVEDLALRRAAELTLALGYDWFRVTERSTDRHAGGGPFLSVGVGGASFGRGSGLGVGADTGIDLGGGPRVWQSLEIMLGHGAPPHDSDVYDAHAVVAALPASG
jgi:hypothetical protein